MYGFSEVLKSLRLEKGFTQDKLAEKLGISRSSIGMYETGNREPDFKMLEVLSELFNVSVDYLIGKTTWRNEEEKQAKFEEWNNRYPIDEFALETKRLEAIDEAEKFAEYLHKRPEAKILFDKTKNATKEDLEKIAKMIDLLMEDNEVD